MTSDFKENATAMIKILTSKSNVRFLSRCNDGIKLSLLMAAFQGRNHALMQDEGGWLTYEKFIKQASLDVTRMVTNDGLIHSKELDHYCFDEVLILNSLAGYIALQDMSDIHSNCIKNDILLINDVSGSIGLSQAKFGDIIVGSFGKAKPVDLGVGGFIAFDDEYVELFDEVTNKEHDDYNLDYQELESKLKNLKSRRLFLEDKCKQIRADLSDLDIVHPSQINALNVVVRFKDDAEKKFLEDYCNDNKLEYTICPREIRIDDDAISIEVKRLKTK